MFDWLRNWNQSTYIKQPSFDVILRKVCCRISGSLLPAEATQARATAQNDDDGELDDLHPEKS